MATRTNGGRKRTKLTAVEPKPEAPVPVGTKRKTLPIRRVEAAEAKPIPSIRLLPTIEAPPEETEFQPEKPKSRSKRRPVRRRDHRTTLIPSTWLSEAAGLMVDPEVEEKIRQVPTAINEYGFDSWGLNPRTARYGYSVFAWLYRHYWRVQTHGIENVPAGRVLLIGNHSGQLPIDGMMVSVAMLLEAKPPRLCRAMVERWFTTAPVVGKFIQRHGAIVGDPLNCERLLERGEAIVVFPEGARGSGKVWRDRYKLVRFGLGFMRLAIATNTPIVPFGVIGGEEQAPSFVDFKPAAKLLGMPYFPITPTFPWLGLLGAIPYPTKYRIHFGKPMSFRGNPDDRDEVIQRKVDTVKRSIRQLIDHGLEEREGIFF